ncbi:MAG: Fur family transcriptional regulator [Candidatus Hydrogenedentota bacterium]
MKIDNACLDAKVAAFRKRCRDAGLRLTPQRQEVYRELVQASDHPSAEMVHKRVTRRLPTMTLDTVYRTLGTLEEIGLAERVSVVRNTARFDGNMEPHHHFICRDCGEIVDVHSDRLDQLGIERDLPKGFQLHSWQVELRGLCPKCARQKAKPTDNFSQAGD